MCKSIYARKWLITSKYCFLHKVHTYMYVLFYVHTHTCIHSSRKAKFHTVPHFFRTYCVLCATLPLNTPTCVCTCTPHLINYAHATTQSHCRHACHLLHFKLYFFFSSFGFPHLFSHHWDGTHTGFKKCCKCVEAL